MEKSFYYPPSISGSEEAKIQFFELYLLHIANWVKMLLFNSWLAINVRFFEFLFIYLLISPAVSNLQCSFRFLFSSIICILKFLHAFSMPLCRLSCGSDHFLGFFGGCRIEINPNCLCMWYPDLTGSSWRLPVIFFVRKFCIIVDNTVPWS